MKKLLNFVLVNRPETENKWWHRLATVLIVSTTLFVLIIGFFISLDSFNSNKENTLENPTTKPNFADFTKALGVSGTELTPQMKASFDQITGYKTPSVVTPTNSRADEIRNIAKQAQLKTATVEEMNAKYGLPPKINNPIQTNTSNSVTFAKIFNQTSSQVRNPNLGQELVKNFFLTVVISICWFVFWESITYRTLLYIIFGKKK